MFFTVSLYHRLWHVWSAATTEPLPSPSAKGDRAGSSDLHDEWVQHFVAHQEIVLPDVVHDRRLEEIAVGEPGERGALAAMEQRRAFGDRALHHRLVLLELHLRRDGSHLRVQLQWIAERDRFRARDN